MINELLTKRSNELKNEYITGLEEHIQIMRELIETQKQIIQVKDEHIAELEIKVNELLDLSKQAIAMGQYRVFTF